MPRKHLVASQTNKKQQMQAKIWLKLAKEIKAAAKVGGPNIDANPRLKAAVDKALANNLSRESIDRNISGAAKDPANMTTVVYECYGPNGTQFIVTALTDNTNRTASNLRGYLGKINGQIARPNSVKIFFDNYAEFILLKNAKTNEDSILESLLAFNVVDIKEHEDNYEVLVDPSQFYDAKKALIDAGFSIHSGEVKLVAQDKKDITDEKVLEKLERFLDSCEDDDDIQSVVHNLL
ncbi:MAG: YebC/PmpR family DNA-binding transcriptional regulator [Mycoplasma sp.]|nr:YebC/PmpR family DNA-binding transcriptional regulator [Candidatus Hennigella equi]